MTSLEQRQTVIKLINTACASGARQHKACEQIGLSVRTLQRWRRVETQAGDRRASSLRRKPAYTHNQLTEEERQRVCVLANTTPFANLPASQIVPRLADAGQYIASETTIIRILRQEQQLQHRHGTKKAKYHPRPKGLVAHAINSVYSWDITYLPSNIQGKYYYLYAYLDIFSRKLVGWQVYDSECAEHAKALLQSIYEQEGIISGQLTIHSDNGGPMKAQTLLVLMQNLGIAYTRSRPSVSDDNPYSESLFKTLKYRAELPIKPFASLLEARNYVTQLVHWYNEVHQHSSIAYVTPSARHAGLDQAILEQRKAVYEAAKAKHPERWSKQTRQWSYVDAVHLNPEREKIPTGKVATQQGAKPYSSDAKSAHGPNRNQAAQHRESGG
jgi:putative transposase